MYYLLLYSITLTLIVFGIVQYIDKQKQDPHQNQEITQTLLTKSNAILFFMLFMVFTFVLYYALYDEAGDLFSLFGLAEVSSDTSKKINIKDSLYDVKKSVSIDPAMLKRINDPLKYGFEPYASEQSEQSEQSSSSSDSSDSSDSD